MKQELERKIADKMDGHLRKLEGIYSPELIQVIRWSLMIDPLERPQSVFALQKALLEPVPEKKVADSIEAALHKVKGMFSGLGRRVVPNPSTIQENSR